MKKLIFLLFIIIVSKANAQNYTVGTPVNDTLFTSIYNFNASDSCYPSYVYTEVFPYSTVTGVKHILIFTNVTPVNTIYTGTGDTINTGDTLLFSSSQYSYSFYIPLSLNGATHYIFKAIGTPQIANETYGCGLYVDIDGASTCNNFRDFIYYDTCTVLPYTSINNYNSVEQEFFIYPNPTTDNLTIKTGDLRSTINVLRIYDIVGNTVLEKILNDKETNIDVSAFSNGMYFVEIKTENGVMSRKFVKE